MLRQAPGSHVVEAAHDGVALRDPRGREVDARQRADVVGGGARDHARDLRPGEGGDRGRGVQLLLLTARHGHDELVEGEGAGAELDGHRGRGAAAGRDAIDAVRLVADPRHDDGVGAGRDGEAEVAVAVRGRCRNLEAQDLDGGVSDGQSRFEVGHAACDGGLLGRRGGREQHGEDGRKENAQGADIHGANLHRANLHRANLHRANLHRANLHRANLHRANLYRSSGLVQLRPPHSVALRQPCRKQRRTR